MTQVTMPTLRGLRAHAVGRTLGAAGSLADAITALRFVQLDPIRAPARAADLILRQRIAGYRAGDLDRGYPSLPLAEDYVHVYGVMPEATLRLLHPRSASYRLRVEREHPRLAERVLAHVVQHGETHPRDVATALGRMRVVNGWGGASAATTRMLEALHHRGKLRVARRASGIKIYDLARPAAPALAPAARAHALLALLLDVYAPLPLSTFRELARMATENTQTPALRAKTFARIVEGPDVRRVSVAGLPWVLPAGEALSDRIDERVRALAPFDPIVWDRRRFAAFWDWDYRFEAYTPPARRKLGYYALPLLWRDDIVGWVNATLTEGTLAADVGYAKAAPRGPAFRRELDAELERLRDCVGAKRMVMQRGAR